MSTPVRRSISASLSQNGMRNRRARYLPTALLPEPMGPIRKILSLPSIPRAAYRNDRAARRRPVDYPAARYQLMVTGMPNVLARPPTDVTVMMMLPETGPLLSVAGAARLELRD